RGRLRRGAAHVPRWVDTTGCPGRVRLPARVVGRRRDPRRRSRQRLRRGAVPLHPTARAALLGGRSRGTRRTAEAARVRLLPPRGRGDRTWLRAAPPPGRAVNAPLNG